MKVAIAILILIIVYLFWANSYEGFSGKVKVYYESPHSIVFSQLDYFRAMYPDYYFEYIADTEPRIIVTDLYDLPFDSWNAPVNNYYVVPYSGTYYGWWPGGWRGGWSRRYPRHRWPGRGWGGSGRGWGGSGRGWGGSGRGWGGSGRGSGRGWGRGGSGRGGSGRGGSGRGS